MARNSGTKLCLIPWSIFKDRKRFEHFYFLFSLLAFKSVFPCVHINVIIMLDANLIIVPITRDS